MGDAADAAMEEENRRLRAELAAMKQVLDGSVRGGKGGLFAKLKRNKKGTNVPKERVMGTGMGYDGMYDLASEAADEVRVTVAQRQGRIRRASEEDLQSMSTISMMSNSRHTSLARSVSGSKQEPPQEAGALSKAQSAQDSGSTPSSPTQTQAHTQTTGAVPEPQQEAKPARGSVTQLAQRFGGAAEDNGHTNGHVPQQQDAPPKQSQQKEQQPQKPPQPKQPQKQPQASPQPQPQPQPQSKSKPQPQSQQSQQSQPQQTQPQQTQQKQTPAEGKVVGGRVWPPPATQQQAPARADLGDAGGAQGEVPAKGGTTLLMRKLSAMWGGEPES